MVEQRNIVAEWIAREVLPHEHAVRKSLRARWRGAVDIEEVVQDAYCRLVNLDSVEHIDNPIGYFLRAAHSVAADRLRRDGIINFTSMNEIEWSNVIDDEPLADRTIEASQELGRVNRLLGKLSETCRRAIELRRVEGVSQRETAELLGVSESIVRNHLVRGVRQVMEDMANQDAIDSGDEADCEERGVTRIG